MKNRDNTFKISAIELITECGQVVFIEELEKLSETSFSFSKAEINGVLSLQDKDNTLVASISVKIENETSYHHKRFKEDGISLILDVKKDSDFLAHYNYNGWWTRPDFCENTKEIPKNTQVLSWQNNENSYVILTICDEEFKSIINPDNEKIKLTLTANTNGYSYVSTKAFVLSFDKDPYLAYETAMKTAFEVLDTTKRNSKERRYPDVFNYLGFCTWNAFYSDVNEDGVMQKAKEFKDKNLPVKWFLLDHGWSPAEGEKLLDFKEDFNKFPSGLKGLKRNLKDYGVENLGVWQGFGGHWGTISKNSSIYNKMGENLLCTNTGDVIPYPSKEKSFAFWNEWHRYLKKQEIDFVKVDIQSSLSVFTKGLMPIGKASKESHMGLEASVGINFDGAMINCMGMAMEQVFNRPISAVTRNSNDFFPKKEQSFKTHVYENAYNTLYHSYAVLGDWDMWWTNHKEAKNNAYLRALSGGPLYISDRVAETVAEMIFPLILNDGYVLRCDRQGVVAKSQIYKKKDAVKVCNVKGNTGYLGVFNCNLEEKTVPANISVNDINGFAENKYYLVYDYNAKKASVISQNEIIKSELNGSDSALYSFTPIVDKIAFLGLCDKYISSAAIEYQRDNFYILKQGGEVLFYSEDDVKVRLNGKEMKCENENKIYKLDCRDVKEKVILEII